MVVEIFKCVANNAFKHGDLAVAEFSVFVGTAFLRQRPIPLPYKHNKISRKPIGHLHGFHYAAERFVVTPQIVNLPGQVLLNGAQNAGIEKLRGVRTVEVAAQIAGIVQNLDVAVGSRSASR
jgi:hypothetical protein